MPKSHIAGWASDSPSPAQLKEFFAQIASRRITRRILQTFLRSGVVFPNEELAREVLGDDIIFPDEIAESRGLSYTKEQLQHFADTMPSEEVLRWKGPDYAIVAGSPKPMGLLKVRELEPELFSPQVNAWYDNQDFAKYDRVMPGWLVFKKEPVRDSQGRSWDEQLKLVPDHLRVPNAAEFAWIITSYYEVRGKDLFKGLYMRTSSVDSAGHHVIFEPFSPDGLRVPRRDEVRYTHVGLAVVRKSWLSSP